MARIRLYLLLSLFFSSAVYSQRVTLGGHVKDAKNGETLLGVSIYVKELNIGVSTNLYGFYAFNLKKGVYTISYSYIGYDTEVKTVVVDSSIVLDVRLQERAVELKTAVVFGQRKDNNIVQNQMSTQKLEMNTIKQIPSFFGEVDLIKAIQLLPGVNSIGEGSTSYSVRGGAIDQNMVFLDEAPVYNISHFMGFFSVFNNDVIKNITLYKGDIPVSYDGRISSLLEVSMKDGNNQRFALSGGVGTISSRITLEGPIIKDRTSFIFSMRRSYADLFLQLYSQLSSMQFFFYDFNLKLNHKFDEKNRLYISSYFGRDEYKISDDGYDYGNKTFTIRWNHLYSKSLFSNLTAVFSDYDYEMQTDFVGGKPINWQHRMKDYTLKYDFSYYYQPELTFKFGMQNTLHKMEPGNLKSLETHPTFHNLYLAEINSIEQGVYLQGDYQLNEKITLMGGVRMNVMSNIGPGKLFKMNDEYKVVDTITYAKGKIAHTYINFAPRFGVTYLLSSSSSVKANYSRNNQFIQMATTTLQGNPMDTWFASNENIKPQTCDQFALGFYHNMSENRYEASAEVYYKRINHAIDFKDNPRLLLNNALDAELRFGASNAYGAEFYVRKKEGPLTGWISYSYSKTMMDIDENNNNQPYLSPFDRTHTFYIVSNLKLSSKFVLGANFVYASGRPISAPVVSTIDPVTGVAQYDYSQRNNYRMPDNHRLDMSLTWIPKGDKVRKWRGEWNLTVYNVYDKRNIYDMYFLENSSGPNYVEAHNTYLFSILPALTYNFRF